MTTCDQQQPDLRLYTMYSTTRTPALTDYNVTDIAIDDDSGGFDKVLPTVIGVVSVSILFLLIIILVIFSSVRQRRKPRELQTEAELVPLKLPTVLDVFNAFLGKIEELLDISVQQDSDFFDEKAVKELLSVADELLKIRRKKNIGVITGTSASIAGGVIGLAGSALVPVTFGMSVGLMLAGTGLGLAGAGMKMGFTLEHDTKNRKRIEAITPSINSFISFHNHFAKAAIVVEAIHRFVTLGISSCDKEPLIHFEQREHFMGVIDKINTIEVNVAERSFEETIDHIHEETCRLGGIIVEFLILINEDNQRIVEFINSFRDSDTDCIGDLSSSIPEPTEKSYKYQSFRNFLRQYLPEEEEASLGGRDVPSDCESMSMSGPAQVREGKGEIAAKRAAVITCTEGNSKTVAKVCGNALKVARLASSAGVVLSGLGMAVDVLFLGNAIHDMVHVSRAEEAFRRDKPVEWEETEKARQQREEAEDRFELIRALHELADAMSEINSILRNKDQNSVLIDITELTGEVEEVMEV